ncbi:MAG: DUF3291 domain-containing protein [Gemmatimonadota bacterium]|nr:DUF3291 domain-containing protein [Gemmatimonadota bacterium]
MSITTDEWDLAEFNVARMRAPIADAVMTHFVAALDAINAAAERAPGFLWRLYPSYDGALGGRLFDDNLTLVNMSVWRAPSDLFDYTYRSAHAHVYRERANWFERPSATPFVLWWIARGTIPTVEEGARRLVRLREQGATREGFTFKEPFEPGGTAMPDL